jgi:glycosyltransferase involved in cell wall biosynthesis
MSTAAGIVARLFISRTMFPESQSAMNGTEITSGHNSLRIAAFTFSYLPMMTGISSLVHERIACLLKRGHTVRLFHPQVPEGDESYASGSTGLDELAALGDFSAVSFPTVRNPLRRSFPEAASHKVWDDRKLLEDFAPDVITVDEAAGLYGAASGWLKGYGKPVGIRYAQMHQIPCVNLLQTDWQGYCEHYVGATAFRFAVPAVRRIMKPVVTGYDSNLTPSRFLSDRNRAIYGERVDYLGFHGVDCERFCPENIRFNPMPNDHSPIILSAGRIAREKSVWNLLTAFRQVREAIPNAKLVVLGRGPLLKSFRRKAAAFGDNVMVPGAVFGNQLKGWYTRANVYWTASTTENFSAGIMESLASGTPVIAAAAGGNIEQVVDGVSGYLVPTKDPSAMADRTISLLRDTPRLEAMSQAARMQALELSLENSTERLLSYLHQLIQGKQTSHSDTIANTKQ